MHRDKPAMTSRIAQSPILGIGILCLGLTWLAPFCTSRPQLTFNQGLNDGTIFLLNPGKASSNEGSKDVKVAFNPERGQTFPKGLKPKEGTKFVMGKVHMTNTSSSGALGHQVYDGEFISGVVGPDKEGSTEAPNTNSDGSNASPSESGGDSSTVASSTLATEEAPSSTPAGSGIPEDP